MKVLLLVQSDYSKVVTTSMECSIDLTVSVDPIRNIPYRQAIVSLIYLSVGTRSDILYAVFMLAKYVKNTNFNHWTAVKRVFRYLNGTRKYGLTYGFTDDVSLYGYSDSDWAGDLTNGKSTCGHISILDGGAVS